MNVSVRSLVVQVFVGFLLALSGPRFGIAQPSTPTFVGATVVTSAGDTLSGQAKWSIGAPTAKRLSFRPDSDTAEVSYRPSEVKAVHFEDGRRLVGRVVQLDRVPRDPEEAAAFLRGNQDPLRADTLFLETMVEGPLQLYRRIDARVRYLISTPGGETVELLKRERKMRNAVATSHYYRKQLRRRMGPCIDEIDREVAAVSLRTSELKEVVARYNNCAGEATVFEQKSRSLVETSFGITGAVTLSRVNLSHVVHRREWHSSQPGVVFGLRITARSPHLTPHWAIQLQLLGHRQRFEAEQTGMGEYGQTPLSFLGTPIQGAKFAEFWWIRPMLLGRYDVLTGDWRPYVEAGFTVGYLVDYDSAIGEHYFGKAEGAASLGVVGGIGGEYNRVRMGLHLELSRVNTPLQNPPPLRTLYFSVGYSF